MFFQHKYLLHSQATYFSLCCCTYKYKSHQRCLPFESGTLGSFFVISVGVKNAVKRRANEDVVLRMLCCAKCQHTLQSLYPWPIVLITRLIYMQINSVVFCLPLLYLVWLYSRRWLEIIHIQVHNTVCMSRG